MSEPTTTPQTPSGATDPAVEFLSKLLPRESPVRKRAFSALLRALVQDRGQS